MKTTCWKLFSYLLIDRSAAQARLDQWAREGWELEHIYFGVLAKLRATDRTDLTYFLDWADPKFPEEGDYLQLCADAGWESVQTIDYLNIYASKPGTSPAPIQTDPAIEYQRFRKKVLRRMFIGILLVLAILALNAFSITSSFSDLQRLYPTDAWAYFLHDNLQLLSFSISLSVIAFLLPFWCAGGLAYFLLLVIQLVRWKRALKNDEPLLCLGPRTSRIWGAIRFLGWFTGTLPFPLFLLDTLLNGFLPLSTPIGFLLGSLIGLTIYRENPRIRRRALIFLSFAACLLLCCLLNDPIRSVFDGRIPPPPSLALQGAQTPESTKRMDGLLGSSSKWEYEIDLGYDESRQCYLGTTVYLSAETYTSPGIAQAVMGPIPQYLSPVDGVDGLWCDVADQEYASSTLLLRRGNTQITARYYEHDGPDLAEHVLLAVQTWMDELEPPV